MDTVELALGVFASIRTIFGLAPLVAAGPFTRALRFPPGEDTASAKVFARLFGVRDLALGVIIAWAIPRPEIWMPVIFVNAMTDLGDLGSFAAGMRGRPDLYRPLGLCAAVAGSAVIAWGMVGLLVFLG